MILPPLTGVFAAALLGGCAAAPYDTSMNSCDQEYMMTNPAGAEYYCGPGYGYPLSEGGFLGFVDIDHFHHHHHDHDLTSVFIAVMTMIMAFITAAPWLAAGTAKRT